MKKIIRISILLLLMSGALSNTVLADGGPQPPTCDPTLDPTCKIVTTGFSAPLLP